VAPAIHDINIVCNRSPKEKLAHMEQKVPARVSTRISYQVDLAWYYIKLLNKLGAISSYRDDKKLFYARYHNPYVAGKEHKKK
jgi:hypothetical protein